jgi:hypothetical protein
MTNGKRDYTREAEWEKKKKPERKTQRNLRNKARYEMIKQGKASVGDGKDVGHKKALSKGGSNSLGNLFVQNRKENQSFSRNKDGSMKSEVSKKERKASRKS